jgi:phosphatidate cytidylyltransferase
MTRLLTAAVGVPLALLALFKLPPLGFLALIALLGAGGAVEFVRLLRPAAPGGPLGALPYFVLLATAGLALALHGFGNERPGAWLFLGALFLSLGCGALVLWTQTPIATAVTAWGVLAIGVPYFALPVVSLYWLQRADPWLVFLLWAIVWLGDTAAYYVGGAIGRHRMAPVVSPKKTWEGAAAGFAAGILSVVVWSTWRTGALDWPLLAVGAATSVASQVGDLVESLVKRSAGVKDSGGVFPGHGGLYDRIDALLFAAPAFLAGLWVVRYPGLE